MLLTLHDFFSSLLRGTGLLGLALAVGGVVWGLAVLRAPWSGDPPPRAARRCLEIVGLGAVALGLVRAAALLLESYVLSATLGRPVLAALLATPHFTAGIAHAALALALALTVARLRAKPRSVVGWAVAGVLAALIVMSGAWLSHAAGRLEHRALLMMLTVAHQLGAAVWVGGLVQLGALWRLARYQKEPMTKLDKALFACASYNAGSGRIRQLRLGRLGAGPNVWLQNVEYVAAEKVGQETVTNVSNIYKYYIAYRLVLESQAATKAAVE